jgi:hypothetical protein
MLTFVSIEKIIILWLEKTGPCGKSTFVENLSMGQFETAAEVPSLKKCRRSYAAFKY